MNIKDTNKELLKKNEEKINRISSSFLFVLGFVQIIFIIVNQMKLFDAVLNPLIFVVLMIVSFAAGIYTRICYKQYYTKYIIVGTMLFLSVASNLFFTIYGALSLACPIVLMANYFKKRDTVIITIIDMVSVLVCAVLSVHITLHNETFKTFQKSVLYFNWVAVKDVMFEYALPTLLILGVIAFISIMIANNGAKMLEDQSNIAMKAWQSESELSTASDIQLNAMPDVKKLSNEYVSLSSFIKPAKETGGDFFDAFMLDESNMFFLVADVSDKGLSAAMFMMSVQNTIASLVKIRPELDKVLDRANELFYNKNNDMMFVTVFCGIMNIYTGDISYINAGHENPLVKNGKDVRIIEDDNPQPFLCAFPDTDYKISKTKLMPGEELLVFTDGVIDNINEKGEHFGRDNLANTISLIDSDLCDNIIKELREYSGNAIQYDDITVLSIKYSKGLIIDDTFEFDASESVDLQVAKIDALIKDVCPLDTLSLINSALDDAINNICEYAYEENGNKGKVVVHTKYKEKEFQVTLKDWGMKFNPLETNEPEVGDVNKIGGLGIYLFRQIMDEVKYEYVDGSNELTLIKRW